MKRKVAARLRQAPVGCVIESSGEKSTEKGPFLIDAHLGADLSGTQFGHCDQIACTITSPRCFDAAQPFGIATANMGACDITIVGTPEIGRLACGVAYLFKGRFAVSAKHGLQFRVTDHRALLQHISEQLYSNGIPGVGAKVADIAMNAALQCESGDDLLKLGWLEGLAVVGQKRRAAIKRSLRDQLGCTEI